MAGVWYNTNRKMADGKTPRTVCAHTQAEAKEFEQKGWRPTKGQPSMDKLTGDTGAPVKDVTKGAGSKKSPQQVLLTGTVEKVVGRIGDIKDIGELKSLLEIEQNAKNPRKDVLEALAEAGEALTSNE